MVKEGRRAPEFTLPSTGGGEVSLSDLRGRPVVLYFHPRDTLPGRTREACDLRDAMPRIRRTGAAVFGVSPDSLASHDSFRREQRLKVDGHAEVVLEALGAL